MKAMKDTTSIHVSDEGDFINNIIDEATRILEDADFDFDIDENDEFSSSSSGPQRTVTFSDELRFHEIIGREDYTEKEIRRSWYSAEEKERMIQSKDKMVARLESGKLPKGDMTYRGLECWTVKGGKELDEKIAKVVNAVMDEQDRQWAVNSDDFDLIAAISAKATADSAVIARDLAVQDERDAKLAWESFEDMSVSSQHSSTCDLVAANPRKGVFSPGKKRATTKTSSKRRESKTEKAEKRVSVDTVQENLIMNLCKTEKGKSKSSKSKKPKKARRSNVDPPAPVRRSPSQNASDLLMKMRMTARFQMKCTARA